MAFKGGAVIGQILFNDSGSASTTIGNNSGGAISISTNDTLALRIGSTYFLNNSVGTILKLADITGSVTYPGLSSFSSVVTADVNNVTGTGQNYTLFSSGSLLRIYDQDSNFFAPNFIAPVTGRYHFAGGAALDDSFSATAQAKCTLQTSNRSYLGMLQRYTTVSGQLFNASVSSFADMDAGDQAFVIIFVNGAGSQTVDVNGSAPGNGASYFNGQLVC